MITNKNKMTFYTPQMEFCRVLRQPASVLRSPSMKIARTNLRRSRAVNIMNKLKIFKFTAYNRKFCICKTFTNKCYLVLQMQTFAENSKKNVYFLKVFTTILLLETN